MKFSIKDFFSKCDQICRKLDISHWNIQTWQETNHFLFESSQTVGSEAKLYVFHTTFKSAYLGTEIILFLGPKIWDILPKYYKVIDNIESFRKENWKMETRKLHLQVKLKIFDSL